MNSGSVHSIYITSLHGHPTESVDVAHAVPGMGLEGDRHYSPSGTVEKPFGSGKDVTLIELEAIQAVQREDGLQITPGMARRNIITHEVPLNHLVGKTFQVGGVTLKGIRLCEPCKHLASLTDARLLPALVHRGGLRAEILSEGHLRPGDLISFDIQTT